MWIFILILLIILFFIVKSKLKKIEKIEILEKNEIDEKYFKFYRINSRYNEIEKEIKDIKEKYENFPNTEEFQNMENIELKICENKRKGLKIPLSIELNEKIKNLPLIIIVKNLEKVDSDLIKILKSLAVEHFSIDKFIITNTKGLWYIRVNLYKYTDIYGSYKFPVSEKINVIDLTNEVDDNNDINLVKI